MKRKTQLLLKMYALGMSVEEQKADIVQAIQYAQAMLDNVKVNKSYSIFARRYAIKWWQGTIQIHEEELQFLANRGN